jgi:hypothetical protein
MIDRDHCAVPPAADDVGAGAFVESSWTAAVGPFSEPKWS